MLRDLLRDAERGELREVFAVVRLTNGEWDCSYYARDLDNLLYDVGSALLTARLDAARGGESTH